MKLRRGIFIFMPAAFICIFPAQSFADSYGAAASSNYHCEYIRKASGVKVLNGCTGERDNSWLRLFERGIACGESRSVDVNGHELSLKVGCEKADGKKLSIGVSGNLRSTRLLSEGMALYEIKGSGKAMMDDEGMKAAWVDCTLRMHTVGGKVMSENMEWAESSLQL